MAKRKIRFIKPWGPYKVGDTLDDPTEVTVRTLCFQHKFAKLLGDPNLQAQIEREERTFENLKKDFQFELETKEKIAPAPPSTRKTEIDKDIEKAIESVEPAKEGLKEPPGSIEDQLTTGEGKSGKEPSRKRRKKKKIRNPGDLTDGS